MDRSILSVALEVQIDGQTADTWAEVLSLFADASIYQSWAYGAVCWGQHQLSHVVIRRNGLVVAAVQLRVARLPLVSAGLAYARWGPLIALKGEVVDPAVVDFMIRCLCDEYVNRRGLELQILPPAIANSKSAAYFCAVFDRSGLAPMPSLGNYKTILVDLCAPVDAIRRRLDGKWRNQLNRSERNSVSVESSVSEFSLQEFQPVYLAMWARKNFKTSVNIEEFMQMQAVLVGAARMQVFLARNEGSVIGGLVCSLIGDTAIYLLGATSERARELKAAYLLQWHAMLWLKSQGASSYDLGGIDAGDNPGGYHFKAGFGGVEVNQLTAYGRQGNALSTAVSAVAAWRRKRKQGLSAPVNSSAS